MYTVYISDKSLAIKSKMNIYRPSGQILHIIMPLDPTPRYQRFACRDLNDLYAQGEEKL